MWPVTFRHFKPIIGGITRIQISCSLKCVNGREFSSKERDGENLRKSAGTEPFLKSRVYLLNLTTVCAGGHVTLDGGRGRVW